MLYSPVLCVIAAFILPSLVASFQCPFCRFPSGRELLVANVGDAQAVIATTAPSLLLASAQTNEPGGLPQRPVTPARADNGHGPPIKVALVAKIGLLMAPCFALRF